MLVFKMFKHYHVCIWVLKGLLTAETMNMSSWVFIGRYFLNRNSISSRLVFDIWLNHRSWMISAKTWFM
jgi:hypothetical protein